MTGGFVNLPHGEVFYVDEGRGSTAIVLNSGGRAPCTTMRPLASKLVNGYRVINWDRANQGLSQVAFDGSSQLDLYAEQLRALLDYCGIEKAFLAGPSEGSRVAFRAALRYPERFHGLFLWQIAAGPVVDKVADRNHLQYAEIADEQGMAGVVRTPWYLERVMMNPSNLSRLLQADAALFSSVMRSWHDELRTDQPMPGHTAQQAATMAVPTLIVAGVDGNHPRASSAQLAGVLPRAEFVEAPYTTEEWNRHRFGTYNLYAALPGLAQLLEGFIARTQAQR